WTARLSAEGGDRRDAKTKLQELAQGGGLPTPTYAEVSRSGPAHRMAFVIRVDAPGLGEAEGRGSAKREAEQAAASALLDRLNEA
ncbi:MAG: putative dsRNA-binding protein, partial [Beijerinckiaceae bacterium]